MMQRAVNAKVKASLNLASWFRIWMPIASGAIVYLTTLSQKCKSKALRTYLAPKKLNSKIQSQPYHVTMWRSHLRRTTEKIKRRGSEVKGRNILGSKKSRLRPSTSTPPMSWRKRRRSVTLVRSRISIVRRKVTLPATVLSLKTSVGLGNLRASDW